MLKILKPGIEERLERELVLLEHVGEHLDRRCDDLRIPHLDYRESFQQVREKLGDEIQLENEQQHLRQAKNLFADEPNVHIPELFDHCTSRVTAMERITGGKVTSHGFENSARKRQLAELLTKALLAKPIFSEAGPAMFHGDPHAGNLFFTDEGRLAILDWSLVGTLGEAERTAVVQILLGAITLNVRHIAAILEQLADRERLDSVALLAVVQDWVRRVRYGELPD